MSHFVDRNQKQWSIELNVGTINTIRREVGIDLLDLFNPTKGPDVISRISDPFALVEILALAINKDMTPEEFAQLFDGDAIDRAREALQEAIADFYPSRQRPLLAKVMSKRREVESKATELAMVLLDDPATDRMINELLTVGGSSTKSPASSASTPPPSPSAS